MEQTKKRVVGRVKAYRETFSGPQGEKVLLDLVKTHNIMGPTYTGDVNQMLVREGERNVVLRILALINTNENELVERMKDASQDIFG